ncbi:MAG: HAD family hydrolase [Eubacteriales bacterium]|nr:HAD family hydrolase [Eubacteriales bacterium]
MNYQYILFDLDGTLTESGPGITRSVSQALKRMGCEELSEEILTKFIGPPLVESMMRYGKLTRAEADQAIVYYREYYASKGMFENEVYPGVEKMLQDLKENGKKLAVSTSKPEVYARKIIEHFRLTGYFDVICGATFDESRVDKADIIADTMEKFGLHDGEKSRVLMVGDREHDVVGAKKNGVAAAGVLYGYGSRQELCEAGADYLIASAPELAKKILEEKFD